MIPSSRMINFEGMPSALPSEKRNRLVVSMVTIEGKTYIQSYYGHPQWVFIEGPTNLGDSMRTIDFRTITTSMFRREVKAIMYVYLREGREGRYRPNITTAASMLKQARRFFQFLLTHRKVGSLRGVKQQDCMAYVEHLRVSGTARTHVPLSPISIEKYLLTVELLSQLAPQAGLAMVEPWPHSSAKILSGVPSQCGPRVAKTPVIPEQVLVRVFQAAIKSLEDGPRLLDLRDGIEAIAKSGKRNIPQRQLEFLRGAGWQGNIDALGKALVDIRTACYIIVATLSGCRNHEIGHIETGACFSTVADDGVRTWWFRSRSTKTRVGRTQWMIPELAVRALELMERWAVPLQKKVEREIRELRASGYLGPELAEAIRHRKALFLGSMGDRVRTMRAINMCQQLQRFARKNGVTWALTTHQFRRTFAVAAARSSFGDLRYLKEHFKHWSMDMTLLYAAAGLQEKELLDEVAGELEALQLGVIASWLDPTAGIAGGAAKAVRRFRSENPVRMYPDRSSMVRLLSNEVHLRSNGHAWCTADTGRSCLGSTFLDSTRCVDCKSSVIGYQHRSFYKSMLQDLESLLELEDIGPSGRSRVMRDMARCERVLGELDIPDGRNL